VIDEYFSWTASRVGGIGTDVIAQEVLMRHSAAFPERPLERHTLPVGGQYQWRADGEFHLFNPETIHRLQKAVRMGSYQTFKSYSKLIDEQSTNLCTLRGLLEFKAGDPVPLEEVEPVESLMSASDGRHVVRLNQQGGARDARHCHEPHRRQEQHRRGRRGSERFVPLPNGDSRNSAIKQVASGRFGVTSEYLVNAKELPDQDGAGRQARRGWPAAGTKVYPWVAKTRHTHRGRGSHLAARRTTTSTRSRISPS